MQNKNLVRGGIVGALVLVAAFTCNAQPQTRPSSNQPPAQATVPQRPASQPAQVSLTDQIAKSVAFITVPYGDPTKPGFISGTCFFVGVEDERLGKTTVFSYLVTNRHVATAEGVPTNQLLPYVYIRANVSQKDGTDLSVDSTVPLAGRVRWYFPEDPTVDLAVLPIAPTRADVDIKEIPTSLLATDEVLKSRAVGIGDAVFFVGFFFQFPGISRIEPIYRGGTIAMMPTDPIKMQDNPDDKGIKEHLYLADAHAFHGNSGSPLFVNLGGYRNGTMLLGVPAVYLIGVVNGFIPEATNGKATGAATFEGSEGQAANSGILTFVPAQELRDLLYGAPLQGMRDKDVAAMKKH